MGFDGERQNRDFLQNTSHHDLAQWMLGGMKLKPFSPDDDESDVARFELMFQQSTPKLQTKLADTLTQAIELWSPENHSLGVLRNLADATALINNEAPITTLTHIIDENIISGKDEDAVTTRCSVISHVVDFIDYPQHFKTAERWYNSPTIAWESKFTIFIGFANYVPQKIEKYLPIFFQLIENHENDMFFDVDTRSLVNIAVDSMVERLGPSGVQKLFQRYSGTGVRFAIDSLADVMKTRQQTPLRLEKRGHL